MMRIHHVAMRTADLGRLERFYVDVLGLHVVRRREATGASIWLDFGERGGPILMLEATTEGEPGVPPGTMDLLAFAVEDLAAWRIRIEGAGGCIEAETGHTLYFRDPDGRRLAVSTYPLP
jgi:glyoxylase I family protein